MPLGAMWYRRAPKDSHHKVPAAPRGTFGTNRSRRPATKWYHVVLAPLGTTWTAGSTTGTSRHHLAGGGDISQQTRNYPRGYPSGTRIAFSTEEILDQSPPGFFRSLFVSQNRGGFPWRPKKGSRVRKTYCFSYTLKATQRERETNHTLQTAAK